jgi:TonB family protein
MAEQTKAKAKAKGFWILWSVGVVLLALLVWLGLRYYSAYTACTADHDCGSRALQAALFMERSDVAYDETDNKFVKFLIKPPEQHEDEIPDWLKEKGPPGGADGGGGGGGDARSGLYGLKGPHDKIDPHLAKRLAEDAARNAGVLGLLREADKKQGEQEQIDSIFGEEVPRGALASDGPVDGPVTVAGLELRGSLSKEIVGRIIRRHVAEVKYCYMVARQRRPKLQGRVVVQFTIAATGQVVVSKIQQTTARDRKLERCLTSAVRRWLFPRPRGGGIVIVSAPFVLRGGR